MRQSFMALLWHLKCSCFLLSSLVIYEGCPENDSFDSQLPSLLIPDGLGLVKAESVAFLSELVSADDFQFDQKKLH